MITEAKYLILYILDGFEKQRKKTLKINGKSIIILNMESHFIIISIAIPFITEVTTDSMTCTCKSREGGRGGPNPPWKIQINYITSPPPLQIKIYF